VGRLGAGRVLGRHADQRQVLDAELGATAGLGDQQTLELVLVGLGVTARQAGESHGLDDGSDTGAGELAKIANGTLGAVQGRFDDAHEISFYNREALASDEVRNDV
jgi:hypothetical protein